MQPSGPRLGRSSDRRDVVVLAVVVVVLVAAGSVSGLFGLLESYLRSAPHLAAILVTIVLWGAATAVLAVRSSRRAQRERDLRSEADARYRLLVERVPAVTYTWQEDPRTGRDEVDYISPQLQRLLGHAPEAWLADPGSWARAAHPEDRDEVLAEWVRAIGEGRPFVAEYRMRHADGTWRWIRDEANPVAEAADGSCQYQGVMSDVTDRREAEERVRESERRWRTVLEQLPVTTYMMEYEAEGEQTVLDRWVGPGALALTGYTVSEWVADDSLWERCLHPDDRDRVLATWAEAERMGGAYEADYRMVRKDGLTIWVHEETNIGIRDGHLRADGLLTDVTERYEAESAIRQAEARFRTLVEQVPALIYIEDPRTGENLYVSPQIEEILGFTPQEWQEDPHLWAARLHPDDRDRVIAENEAEGDTWSVDYRSIARDGRVVWLHNEALLVRDEDGEPLYWQGVTYDITERMAAEALLREAEERYRSLVEQLPVAVYTDAVDDLSTAMYVSPRYEQLTGYTPAQRLQEPGLWAAMLHPDDRERVLAESAHTNATGDPFDTEYRIVRADGRTAWLHDHAVLVEGPGGRQVWQGVLQDVTEEKAAEQALRESEQREREAAERLRALDEMKNTFLAAVSHELRSPLTSILGLSLTLERAPDMRLDDRDDLLRRLSANARKLDRLLKDLLDIDRLNRGIVAPQYRTTDVGAIARGVVEHLDLLAGRRLVVEAEPVVIGADPPKLERIVENLLTNAVRHTEPDRRIWLRVGPSGTGVLIAVEDDGPGVPAGIRDAVFEPFRQGPTASPHAPGTGIGLSLVARFAELHGGRAWVEDRPGGGASFRVFIPGAPPLGTTGPDPDTIDGSLSAVLEAG